MTVDAYQSRSESSPTPTPTPTPTSPPTPTDLPAPTPTPTEDLWLGLVDWNASDLPSFAWGVFVALVALVVWIVRAFKARKAEARLVTSYFRMSGNGASLPFRYEITVHNGSGHPLQLAEVHFWDGSAWQVQLVRSMIDNNPVIAPSADGQVVIPVITTDMKKFKRCTYLRYKDSHNRYWHRVIDSPDFLRWLDLKRMRN